MGFISMSNIFSSLKTIYGQKWSVKSIRKMNDEEKESVVSATVVSSQYGNSVCFVLKTGGVGYIPMSSDASAKVGQVIDIQDIELLTLSRQGEADIVRVRC